MQAYRMTMVRLQKQESSFEKDPIPGALVVREGILNFHFCLYDMQGDFKNGFYHGLLELHENYPFKPPKLFFYTPNGRFELNVPICTSFTNYHQQSWTSAWNVRTLVIATISFMQGDQPTFGCRKDSSKVRRELAKKSIHFNLKSQKFVKLFSEKLKEIGKMPDLANEEEESSGDKIVTMQRESLIEEQPQLRNERPVKTLVIVLLVVFFTLIAYFIA